MLTDFSVMAVVLVCSQWSISSIDRHSFPVPDAPETRVLEQGPTATEEAASFGGEISFGGKKIRRSYDAVARFQL